MRLNLPTIDDEFPLPPGASLVSTTDLQGRILYGNPDFVAASGYTSDELVGQPHNLIRHPDVPAAAFEDLWRSIQAGQPWTGLVKNRRKDGRYYWVRANVTPLLDAGRPIGYLSVRTVPTRDEVAAAQSLYRTMRSDEFQRAPTFALRQGELVPLGLRGRWRAAADLVRGPTTLLIAIAVASWAGGARLPAPWSLVPATLAVALLAPAMRRLARGPLRAAVGPAHRMAAGDLSSQDTAGGAGPLMRALGQLRVNLRAIVGDARREVDGLRSATREIASGNADLAQRTESQAAQVQQTAAAIQQITAAVGHSADAALKAAELAGEANARTRQSSDAVRAMARTMQEISDSSSRIGEIIQVIESIAFQTNLLALNAAVEAARAGEQGRGFAVVATEVRMLARRTSEAAREVKSLILRSAKSVESGNQVSDAASQKIAEAADSVDGVHAMIARISTGSRQQLDAISQVNSAISHLDGLTRSNAALVEQIAAAAAALNERADHVAGSMSVFHLDRHAPAPRDAVELRRAAKARRLATLAP